MRLPYQRTTFHLFIYIKRKFAIESTRQEEEEKKVGMNNVILQEACIIIKYSGLDALKSDRPHRSSQLTFNSNMY